MTLCNINYLMAGGPGRNHAECQPIGSAELFLTD